MRKKKEYILRNKLPATTGRQESQKQNSNCQTNYLKLTRLHFKYLKLTYGFDYKVAEYHRKPLHYLILVRLEARGGARGYIEVSALAACARTAKRNLGYHYYPPF